MAYAGKQPIGTMLIQAGKLDEDQLQTALREQQKKDGGLERLKWQQEPLCLKKGMLGMSPISF